MLKTKNYICSGCDSVTVDWEGNPENTCPKCEKGDPYFVSEEHEDGCSAADDYIKAGKED